MKQLEVLFNYKNKFMEDVLTNENIVKLLDDNLPIEQARKLAYTQVFPYEYLPETAEHGHTFICYDIDVMGGENTKTFLHPVLYIWVFTHKSKLRLPNGGGVRTDKLAMEITKAINGSRHYGLGELNFYSMKRFAPSTEFNGKMLSFHATDFNRIHPTGKTIPSNRDIGI